MATIEKRVSDSGAVTFRGKVRRKGQPVQTATFERLTDAKKWAHTAEAAAIEGRAFMPRRSGHILGELIARYVRGVLPHKRTHTAKDQKQQLGVWAERGGHLLLSETTPTWIAEVRDTLLSEGRSGPVSRTSAFTTAPHGRVIPGDVRGGHAHRSQGARA